MSWILGFGFIELNFINILFSTQVNSSFDEVLISEKFLYNIQFSIENLKCFIVAGLWQINSSKDRAKISLLIEAKNLLLPEAMRETSPGNEAGNDCC